MKWSKLFGVVTLSWALFGCAKHFNSRLLEDNKAKIDPTEFIKYYDQGSGFFYLLTFYRTVEQNPGEDFTFEGVSTYKGSQGSTGNIEGDTAIIQYLALYFFENGGVVYHTKYKIAPQEKYVPLDLASFDDLYQKDKIRRRGDRTEYKRYRPIMQGYQSKRINAQKVVKPRMKEDTNSSKEKIYAVRNSQLFNQAVTDGLDSTQTNRAAQGTPRVQAVPPPDLPVIKLYLERRVRKPPLNLRGKHGPKRTDEKSSIYLLGKHQPGTADQKEAILIEQIFYHQEVQSAGGRYIPALLSEVFDLGTITDTNTPFKSLFWFRLEKRDNFKGNLPNNKR